MGHGQNIDVVAGLTSDEDVEYDQHRDNFSLGASHFYDYYDRAPKNYQYS